MFSPLKFKLVIFKLILQKTLSWVFKFVCFLQIWSNQSRFENSFLNEPSLLLTVGVYIFQNYKGDLKKMHPWFSVNSNKCWKLRTCFFIIFICFRYVPFFSKPDNTILKWGGGSNLRPPPSLWYIIWWYV